MYVKCVCVCDFFCQFHVYMVLNGELKRNFFFALKNKHILCIFHARCHFVHSFFWCVQLLLLDEQEKLLSQMFLSIKMKPNKKHTHRF